MDKMKVSQKLLDDFFQVPTVQLVEQPREDTNSTLLITKKRSYYNHIVSQLSQVVQRNFTISLSTLYLPL